MVAILNHIADHSAFEPEEIQTMSTAFELACADLAVFAGDQRGREIIAKRIIDLVRKGVAHAPTLHQRVVAEARAGI